MDLIIHKMINNSVLWFILNSLECRFLLHLLMGICPSWVWLSLSCSMESWIDLVTPHTYTHYVCVNSGIHGMEAHGCGGGLMLFKLCFPKNKVYLPNLHMNRYLGPSSILIRFFYLFIDTGSINDSPTLTFFRFYLKKSIPGPPLSYLCPSNSQST